MVVEVDAMEVRRAYIIRRSSIFLVLFVVYYSSHKHALHARARTREGTDHGGCHRAQTNDVIVAGSNNYHNSGSGGHYVESTFLLPAGKKLHIVVAAAAVVPPEDVRRKEGHGR